MQKDRRLEYIEYALEKVGFVKVDELQNKLKVSDMTIRRDLNELEKKGKAIRTHGGARSLAIKPIFEMSHTDKSVINLDKKEEIAKLASSIINNLDSEIIFLGPGTTIEMLAKLISNKSLTIVTNSLPVFITLSNMDMDIYLLGGKIRNITQSFNGGITNDSLYNMKFHKIFFSCNAISENDVMTSTISEASTQRIALKNSAKKYLLADSSKFGKSDFISFASADELDYIITNKENSNKHIINSYDNIL